MCFNVGVNKMKVIAVASEKGGVGKTTTAVHLAAYLATRGETVLVDADEHLQSALQWTTDTEAFQWPFARRAYRSWKLEEPFEWAVLDTKGGEGPGELVTLARNCFLLVIPSKPDGVSARGLTMTLRPLLEAGIANYKVLLTDVPSAPNTDGLEMRATLEDAGIPVFAQAIRHAVAVSKAASQGVSVREVRGDRYAKMVWLEHEAVAKEVMRYGQGR